MKFFYFYNIKWLKAKNKNRIGIKKKTRRHSKNIQRGGRPILSDICSEINLDALTVPILKGRSYVRLGGREANIYYVKGHENKVLKVYRRITQLQFEYKVNIINRLFEENLGPKLYESLFCPESKTLPVSSGDRSGANASGESNSLSDNVKDRIYGRGYIITQKVYGETLPEMSSEKKAEYISIVNKLQKSLTKPGDKLINMHKENIMYGYCVDDGKKTESKEWIIDW